MVKFQDLILYNGVESTDLIQGATQLPYRQTLAFAEGFTFVSGWEEYTVGSGSGRGSNIIIRGLGIGKATRVNVNTAGALDYTHEYEGDAIRNVPVDIVIKKSEKIYDATGAARNSADEGKKAQLVLNSIFDEWQAYLTETLLEEVNTIADTTNNTDPLAFKNELIDVMTENLDRVPTILMVGRKGRAKALKLQTTGDFVPVYDAILTGTIGTLLGMTVVYNPLFENDVDYVMYNPQHFFAFNNFYDFGRAENGGAFKGYLVQGILLSKAIGDRDVDIEHANPLGIKRVVGNGAWGVLKKIVAE
jgi:hypothetical protein